MGGSLLWYDERRQVWKTLIHAGLWKPQTSGCQAVRVAGFAFSEDGETWVRSPVEPFTTKVRHVDGSSYVYSTLERPKLVFNDAGDPVALYTSASRHWGCRLVPGIDWVFTLMQPIGVQEIIADSFSEVTHV